MDGCAKQVMTPGMRKFVTGVDQILQTQTHSGRVTFPDRIQLLKDVLCMIVVVSLYM